MTIFYHFNMSNHFVDCGLFVVFINAYAILQKGIDVANDVAEDTGDVDALLYREVQNILEVTNYLYLCSAHLQLEGVSGLGLS